MQRRRTRSRQHPIGTPTTGLSPNTGPLASAAWLAERELAPSDPKWFVELVLGTETTRFQLEVYAEEWGFVFTHDDRTSWIRVTDIPFVHGSDEHGLLSETPPLKNIGQLVRTLERRYGIQLRRTDALVRTTMLGVEQAIREWAASL